MYNIIIFILMSFIFLSHGIAFSNIISCPPEDSWTVEDLQKTSIEKPLGLNIDKDPSEIISPILDYNKEIKSIPEENSKERARIGTHHQLPKIGDEQWRVISDIPGKYSIRIVIYAPNAKIIRAHFKNVPSIGEAKVFVYGDDKKTFSNVLSERKSGEKNEFWAAPIFGQYYYIECEYSDRSSVIKPIIDKISIVDKNLFLKVDKVRTCHNDISCSSDDIKNRGNGVALIIFEESIYTYACSGALLNDLDPSSQIPWFLTANHCGIDDDVAPTAVFYFKYQTSTCNGVDPSYPETPSILGASHIVSYELSDFTLLKLWGNAPAGSTFLGWTTAPIEIGNQSYTIHHPDRSFKRISYGEVINFIDYSIYDDTNYVTVRWNSGSTEHGSSGAPLLIGSQVVGQLRGGPASCYVSGDENRDYFGRFSVSWNHGLSRYLRPADSMPNRPSLPSIIGLLLLDDENSPVPPTCPVILNGDFESGDTAWAKYSLLGYNLISSHLPHNGSYGVWLGGANNETCYIQQQITVPSSCPFLLFYQWIYSEDSCGHDYGYVLINGVNVATLNLCETENTGGWVESRVNLSSYAGQTVTLRFRAHTNASMNSNWFIDDVSFQSSD